LRSIAVAAGKRRVRRANRQENERFLAASKAIQKRLDDLSNA
jgi:hypothetical protein